MQVDTHCEYCTHKNKQKLEKEEISHKHADNAPVTRPPYHCRLLHIGAEPLDELLVLLLLLLLLFVRLPIASQLLRAHLLERVEVALVVGQLLVVQKPAI